MIARGGRAIANGDGIVFRCDRQGSRIGAVDVDIILAASAAFMASFSWARFTASSSAVALATPAMVRLPTLTWLAAVTVLLSPSATELAKPPSEA